MATEEGRTSLRFRREMRGINKFPPRGMDDTAGVRKRVPAVVATGFVSLLFLGPPSPYQKLQDLLNTAVIFPVTLQNPDSR